MRSRPTPQSRRNDDQAAKRAEPTPPSCERNDDQAATQAEPTPPGCGRNDDQAATRAEPAPPGWARNDNQAATRAEPAPPGWARNDNQAATRAEPTPPGCERNDQKAATHAEPAPPGCGRNDQKAATHAEPAPPGCERNDDQAATRAEPAPPGCGRNDQKAATHAEPAPPGCGRDHDQAAKRAEPTSPSCERNDQKAATHAEPAPPGCERDDDQAATRAEPAPPGCERDDDQAATRAEPAPPGCGRDDDLAATRAEPAPPGCERNDDQVAKRAEPAPPGCVGDQQTARPAAGPRVMRWLRHRTRSAAVIGWVAFVVALAIRLVRLPDTQFARDQAVSLWMALDAVRQGYIPDHGLVSSYLAFDPPGLEWLMIPAVWAGHGDPTLVMAWFAVLASTGIALLVWTFARFYACRSALVLLVLLASSPADALAPALLWHVSLYMGAVTLMLAAALHLRNGGSYRWAVLLGAMPVLYTLIHYSGLLLIVTAPLLIPRSQWRSLALPMFAGTLVAALLWVPFFRFEVARNWFDLRVVVATGRSQTDFGAALADRFAGFLAAMAALGSGHLINPGRISTAVLVVALGGLAYGAYRRRPVALLAGGWLIAGTALQAAAGMGNRSDITMLWNTPLLVLAALALASLSFQRIARGLLAVLIAGNLYIFYRAHNESVDRGDSLRQNWARAGLGDAWQRSTADALRTPPEAAVYLSTDPPVVAGVGSEVWYLREVIDPGSGQRAALANKRATPGQ